MRTQEAGTAVPDTLTMTLDDLIADPAAGRETISAADRTRRRIELAGAARFGVEPAMDVNVLRFLSEATSRLVDLDWTLTGSPPWPVRTVLHLVPPARHDGRAAAEFAGRWRAEHRFGLCVYRRGPDFVRIRDTRPGGPHLDVLIEGPWVTVFDAVAAGPAVPVGDRSQKLIAELADAGLALRLGPIHHLLPFHRRRAPIPSSGR